MNPLIERLKEKKLLIADGAWGTELTRAGLKPGVSPESWNLENPDAVRSVAQSYVDAGADIIITNTFGGNRLKLEKSGLAENAAEINRSGAAISREAANGKALVFASMGPTGEFMEPLGTVTADQMVDLFAEQAASLVQGGADGIVVETMTDLGEAKAALQGVRNATDLPVIVSMTFDRNASGYATMMGVTPAQAAADLDSAGADIIGTNCGAGMKNAVEIVVQMREATGKPIWSKSNAGLPEMIDGQTVFRETPEEMVTFFPLIVEAGAHIVGGCCGTTPEHIAAFSSARDNLLMTVTSVVSSIQDMKFEKRQSADLGKNDMNIAVFGASGNVGAALIPELIRQGHRIRAMKHQSSLEAQGAEIISGSITDSQAVCEVIRGVDIVLQMTKSGNTPDQAVHISTRGTLTLLDEILRSCSVRQYILTSSDAATGICAHPHPQPISHKTEPMSYNGYYSLGKVLEETIVREYHRNYKIPYTIARLSWVCQEDKILRHLIAGYNPDQPLEGSWSSLYTPEHRERLCAGERFIVLPCAPDGTPLGRTLVQRQDVVSALIRMIGNPRAVNQRFHVSGPGFRYDEPAQYLSQKTGLTVEKLIDPDTRSFDIDYSHTTDCTGWIPQFTIQDMIDAALVWKEQKCK